MGSLYRQKYKDGKLGKVWWLKYYTNGKPIRESSRSTSKMVAERLLKQREGEIAQGKVPGVYFDRVTFDELAQGFLLDYRLRGKKSIPKAERSVKRLQKFFGGLRANAIDTPKINQFIEARLAEGVVAGTVNRELSALRRMFNLGAKTTPPKIDRVPHIPMLREDNVREGFFEHAEFLALRDALPDYLKGFVTFGYRTGWRFSEITNLQWKDVDRVRGIVRLQAGKTKNDKGRMLYLDDELQRVIDLQWETRKRSGKLTPHVFPNRDGSGPIVDIRFSWKKACKAVKIGKKLFHDFRRTAVRNMIRAGIPERVAMQISGHKTRSVFDRYNIVSEDDLRLAAQKQAAYLSEKPNATGIVSGIVAEFPTKKGLTRKS